jgi:outer membrane biosynthesis protein TonB
MLVRSFDWGRGRRSRPTQQPTSRLRGRLSLESLESRQMMAGVVFRLPTKSTKPASDPPVVIAPPAPTTPPPSTQTTTQPAAALPSAVQASAPESLFNSIYSLNDFSTSASSGEKPQSKVWQQDGSWFTIMPDKTGTWVRRLDGSTWTSILKLSTTTSVQADIKQVGNVVHAFLYNGTNSQLASIEFVPATANAPGHYQAWSARPNLVNVTLPSGIETATIDVDSTGRMWLVTDPGSRVVAMYSDGVYNSWSTPITIATGIDSGDLATVIALPTGQTGVFWSNHKTKRFGFRTHLDGTDPNAWSADEIPGDKYALSAGAGMADDHVHLAVSADGTLYAFAKTSYDKSGYPMLILMVRRPNGVWDPVYDVDTKGTRPNIVISEAANRLILIYTNAANSNSGGGEIVYRESPLDAIQIGARRTLIATKTNDATTTKNPVTNEVVVIASSGSTAKSVLLRADSISPLPTPPANPQPEPEPTPPPPPPQPDPIPDPTPQPEPQPEPGPQPEPAPEPEPTPDPLPEPEPVPSAAPVVAEFQDGVTAGGMYAGTRDSMIWGDKSSVKKNYGTTKDLQANGNPDRAILLSWDVSSIPQGSLVQGAQITLQVTGGSVDTFEVYALTKGWDEKQVTWSQAAKGSNWSAAGIQGSGDHAATPIGTLTATAKGLATITLNADGVAAVQSWINNPSKNFGIVIKDYSASSDILSIASREVKKVVERPKLSIAYSSSQAINQATAYAIAAGLDATQKKV